MQMIALVCSLVQDNGASNMAASTGMTIIHALMRPRIRWSGDGGSSHEDVGSAALRGSGTTCIPSAGPTSVDVALVFSALCRIKVTGMDPRIDRYGRRTRSTTSSIFRNMGRSDPGQEGRQKRPARPEMGAWDQADREEGGGDRRPAVSGGEPPDTQRRSLSGELHPDGGALR